MLTKLERLLADIAPERTLDTVAARADAAVNSSSFPSARSESWDGFVACLGHFFRHIENSVLRLGSDFEVDPQFDWGRCRQLLVEAFGSNGEQAAFEMARSGAEGGLYAVVRAVAEGMVNQYANNEIRARVSEYWNKLTVDEQLAAPHEYLAMYGHLLPTELTEGSAARIRGGFPKVLQQHPHLLSRLRQTGR